MIGTKWSFAGLVGFGTNVSCYTLMSRAASLNGVCHSWMGYVDTYA